jgi:hypothetical protein
MAGKADFTPDEWATMQRALMGAVTMVMMADGGRKIETIREMGAVHRQLAEHREQHHSQLVRELADVPEVEDEAATLASLRAAVAAVGGKAPGETAAFRELVLGACQAAAEAVGSGPFGIGGQKVNEHEEAVLDRIRDALGAD